MLSKSLAFLSDAASEAHARIQREFQYLDPVVGVNQSMRSRGVPADLMTIDCLKSGKRIIIILHDQQPDTISYQFSYKDRDPNEEFESMSLSQLTPSTLYEWMKNYFTTQSH